MDNNKEQSMQNWKKLLILDPVLNSLFQQGLDVKDFLHQRILTQDHEQIVGMYTKLSSVKHALSKTIQKEVEMKHELIEQSFLSKHHIENKLRIGNVGEIENLKKSLSDFNSNYETVKEGSIKLQNVMKVIRFSKALEKLKINIRLLRTFMKDHLISNAPSGQVSSYQSQPQQSSSPTTRINATQQSLNLSKVSKLLKQINQLLIKNDFSGIKYYQQQKAFINSSKQTLYTVAQKQLVKTIERYKELIREDILSVIGEKEQTRREKMAQCVKDIEEKLIVLHSINKLRQYIPVFGKAIFSSTSQQMKSLFQQSPLTDFSHSLQHEVLPLLLTNSFLLIKMQELLYQSSLSQRLQLAYNLPNLFTKYIQHLVSYWRNLVNWNMEQDSKQMQKRKMQDKSYTQEKQIVEVMMSTTMGNKKSSLLKFKLPLWYKYPLLYNGLSILVNKIHEQILLYAEYNPLKYQFSQKKQQIMSTLIPLGRKFYQRMDNFVFDSQNDLERVKRRVQCLQWVYKQLFGVGCVDGVNITCEGFAIVQGMNKKVLQFIEAVLLQKDQQNINKAQSFQISKLFLRLVDRKQVLQSYTSLQTLIQHLLRIKNIKSILTTNESQQCTQQNHNQQL